MFFKGISHLASIHFSGRFQESCGILSNSLKRAAVLVTPYSVFIHRIVDAGVFVPRYAEQLQFCFLSHKSIHTGRRAAAVSTMSSQGDLQNGTLPELKITLPKLQKKFTRVQKTQLVFKKHCLGHKKLPETCLTYCFSPGPVPKQSMAQQIEI